MNRPWLRFAELLALSVVALAMLGVAAYMVHMDRMGEAFGTLVGAVVIAIQAIRNIGQAQAMNAMADYLARSQPSELLGKDGE